MLFSKEYGHCHRLVVYEKLGIPNQLLHFKGKAFELCAEDLVSEELCDFATQVTWSFYTMPCTATNKCATVCRSAAAIGGGIDSLRKQLGLDRHLRCFP